MRRGTLVVAVIMFMLGFLSTAGTAQSSGLKITGFDFDVKVDDTVPCMLMMNGMIKTEGKGKLWYGFVGPNGVTFDFGPEDTSEIKFGHGVGVGKGAKFTTDIRGQFVLKAAVVDANGKKGPIMTSKPVPGNYTCGNGAHIARAVAAGTPMPKSTKPVPEIKSAKLTVEVAKSSNCTINLRGEVATAGIRKLWYRFEAPPGSKFDYAAEYTEDIELGSSLMMDKSITFTKDIHGVFVLRTAAIDESGKKGPVVSSKILPGNYTCGEGTQVAKPIIVTPKGGPRG